MPGNIVLDNPLFLRETITGSKAEREIVGSVMGYLEEARADHIKEEPVGVLNWSEKYCEIEYTGFKIPCHAMPYSLSADIEGQIAFARYIGDRIVVDTPINDKIVLIPLPSDPDDAQYVLFRLQEHGAKAIIFYDELPGRYRRIVLTGAQGFPFNYGACLLYTSPSPRDLSTSRMPSSA